MSGDPELEAMSAVSGALAPLDPEVQGRVLRWAAERFGVPMPNLTRNGSGGAQDVIDEFTEEEVAKEAPTFEHFGELFAAADPKSNEDKALVAAYWIQLNEAHSSWPSRLLNGKLKPLGHNILNITDALTSNINKRPQRVILLGKSGGAQQANKTYKVTTEGMVYVQGMLGGTV